MRGGGEGMEGMGRMRGGGCGGGGGGGGGAGGAGEGRRRHHRHHRTPVCASEFVEVCFHKNGHNSGQNRSPDMILTAFDGKLNEKKDEIPPGACRPPYT